MILATEQGDGKLELFWREAMDRFLDTYAREAAGDDVSSDQPVWNPTRQSP